MTRIGLPLIGVAAFGAIACSQRAEPGTVRVKVVDSVTGSPVEHAAVQATGLEGLGFTNSAGMFTLSHVPASAELRVRCPSARRMVGRVIARRPLTGDASASSVTVQIPAASCTEPAISSTRGSYSGVYTEGFEANDLKLCEGLPAAAKIYDDSTSLASVTFAKGVTIPAGRMPKPDSTGYSRTFVHVEGTLTGPGSFGHVGHTTYELTVERVLDVRAPGKNDCK